MKKIILLLCLISTLALFGCEEYPEREPKDTTESMFVIVEGGGIKSYVICYHKETKVMYAVSNGTYNGGTFTVMVNPDGTPMIWEE